MNSTLAIKLSSEEKEFLRQVAVWSILRRLSGEMLLAASEVPVPPTVLLQQERGAFVTLSLHGQLRGCIGNIVGQHPLYITIAQMAQAAAFEDPRFSPLRPEELDDIEVSLSVIEPLQECSDPHSIIVGKHGLLIRHGRTSGVLLPQVPVEFGWDRHTFLQQVCLKAGLPRQAWQEEGVELYCFEAEVF